MEYYSAFKRTETSTRHNMEESCQDLMPSKISQSQKDKYYVISLISGTGIDTFIETESRVVGLGGEENGELIFNGYSFRWGR